MTSAELQRTRDHTRDAGGNVLLSAAGRVPQDRLQLLRSLFGRVCQTLRDKLFDITKVNFETSLIDIGAGRVAESGASGEDWLVALCSIKGHNTLSCMAFDAEAVNLIAETFLGGGAKGRHLPPPRPFTPFDHLLTGHAAEILADSLMEAFAPSMELSITIDEVRAADKVEEFALEERPVLHAGLKLEALGESGELIILLPPAILSGLSSCELAAAPALEAETGDNPWREALDARLMAAEVTCRAVMDGGSITLQDVAHLKPGQVLPLETRPEAPVTLECNGETFFHCGLGQANGVFTLKLHKPAGGREDVLQSVLDSEGSLKNG